MYNIYGYNIETIKRIIFEFKSLVEDNLKIRIDSIYLFGSRARGDYRVDSDIDLILVSDMWKGSMIDRMKKLYRLWRYELDATLIPLTHEELEKKMMNSITIRDASRYWIKIL